MRCSAANAWQVRVLYSKNPKYFSPGQAILSVRSRLPSFMCILHLSDPKLEHITARSVQSAQHVGRARSVRTGRRQNSRPRRRVVLILCTAWWTQCLNDFQAARKSEVPWRPKPTVDKQFAIWVSMGREKVLLPTCPLVERFPDMPCMKRV